MSSYNPATFDHFNIVSRDLDYVSDFFIRVLDLRVGPRPPFSFPGLWLYNESGAAIHVSGVPGEPAQEAAFGHIAFCSDRPASKLINDVHNFGIEPFTKQIPETSTYQIFAPFPGGLVVEINTQSGGSR
ncbi:MAG: hypothetical protein ABW116_18080 [Candidatus Sedimenticola sp. 20ELBAFRAG]